MRLLVTHRRAALYTSQYIANVREGPRTEMAHGQSRLIVEIRVAVNLTFFVVHYGLHQQTVDPYHV